MKPMLAQIVEQRLRTRTGGVQLRRRVLKIAGRSESRVEELTQPSYSRWRDETPPIETTILAAPGQIELHLSARGDDEAALAAVLDRGESAIRQILPHDVFSADGRSLEEVTDDGDAVVLDKNVMLQ
jgi:nicotinamide-nucleotide amidase